MISRYTRPEMGRVWSEENRFQKWLDVELAATETLAEAGNRSARSGPKAARTRAHRCEAHQRNRGQSTSRRDRLHHRGAGNRRRHRSGTLAALRPHLERCGGHRAGAADSRSLAPDRKENRSARRSAGTPGLGIQRHAGNRPHARNSRGADHVWPENRELVCGKSPRSRALSSGRTANGGRQDFRGGRDLHAPGSGNRRENLPAPWAWRRRPLLRR